MTSPNELARAALEAAARARSPGAAAPEVVARLAEAADLDGRLSVREALTALADDPPVRGELAALGEDKAARNRALIDLLHNPQIEEDNET